MSAEEAELEAQAVSMSDEEESGSTGSEEVDSSDEGDDDVNALLAEAEQPLPESLRELMSRPMPPQPPPFALHDAAEAGNVEEVKRLLSLAAEADLFGLNIPIDEKDGDGCTPLHVALLSARVDIAALLLQAKAQTSLRVEGNTPLHIAVNLAAFPHHADAALQATRLLLEHGADAASTDLLGRTPLHWASHWGDAQIVKLLLGSQNGLTALVHPDNCGDTPLHLCAKMGHADAAAALLEAGANVHATNKLGQTPLHYAAAHGALPVVPLLLHAGTSRDARDARGFTAEQCALQRGHASAAAAIAGRPAAAQQQPDKTKRTLLITDPVFLRHYTCKPIQRAHLDEAPPENVRRLEVLLDPSTGILRAKHFAALEWENNAEPAKLIDIMRCHEFHYVQRLLSFCEELMPGEIGHLDSDTSISRESFDAALRAAGAVLEAIDRVLSGRNRNAFCAVRPPGHHAGPAGVVKSSNDPHGSHGFCLLNNVAIGAAYALDVHRHRVKRVAIVDFDVHHGNGTEDIVYNLRPRKNVKKLQNEMGTQVVLKQTSFKPWLDRNDAENVFFASVHGFGSRQPGMSARHVGWFYPASGETNIQIGPEETSSSSSSSASSTPAVTSDAHANSNSSSSSSTAASDSAASLPSSSSSSAAPADDAATAVRFHVYDIGMAAKRPPREWRQAWRDGILRRLAAFQPDLILISAGFDAHMRDSINMGYLGVQEPDYEWLTEQIKAVANKCCGGRVVAVLEGGYRVEGKFVSPFARSVAATVSALLDPSEQEWSEDAARWERSFEIAEEKREREERERKEREERERREREYKERLQRLEAERLERLKRSAEQAGLDTHDTPGDAPAVDVALPAPGETASTASAAAAASSAPSDSSQVHVPLTRSKRRRVPVDYVALNKKLDEEAAARRAAMAGQAAGAASGDANQTTAQGQPSSSS